MCIYWLQSDYKLLIYIGVPTTLLQLQLFISFMCIVRIYPSGQLLQNYNYKLLYNMFKYWPQSDYKHFISYICIVKIYPSNHLLQNYNYKFYYKMFIY